MQACTHISTHVLACAHGGLTVTLCVSLDQVPLYLLRLNLDLPNFSWPSQAAQPDIMSLSLMCWDCTQMPFLHLILALLSEPLS